MDYNAWSQTFITDTIDTATCIIDVGEWRRVHDEYEGAKRIFAKLNNTNNGTVFYMALGSPIYDEMNHNIDKKSIFLKQFVLDTLQLDSGENIQVEWMTNEYFPEATRIVLRPHDSAFFHADAKEELERALTRIGVLQMSTTISVPLELLGGFNVLLDVITLEPATIVLMEGDEVTIEFEGALDSMNTAMAEPVAEPVAVHVAEHVVVPVPVPFTNEPLIPSEPLNTFGVGNTLGGSTRSRLLDGRAWNPWRL